MVKSPNNESQNNASIWFGVSNPKWISIKTQYFFLLGGLATVQPYLVLFYASLGLKTPQIGVIEFLMIVISMIARPVIGSIADKSRRHTLVLCVCIAAFLIPSTTMGFFSTPDQAQHPVTLTFGKENLAELQVCGSETKELLLNTTSLVITSESKPLTNNTGCQLTCKDLPASNHSVSLTWKPKIEGNCSVFLLKFDNQSIFRYNESQRFSCYLDFFAESQDSSRTFLWICLLRSLSAITWGPAISLTDAIAYDMLGPQHRGSWGQQRMFGTLAWGIGAGIMGLVIDTFHTFKFCFVTFAFLISATIFIALFWLPRRLNKINAVEENVPFCKALKSVFISPIFCINCLVAIASGMFLGICQVLWPQLIRELGAPKILFGLAALVVCAFEIPSLFFAGAVVNRIGEPVCFLLMFLAYTIRFGANAFLTSETVWLALAIESLHLFCYGLYFSAASRTAATIAPPGTSSTVQALLATSYSGIGTGSGVLMASAIYHNFGRRLAFLIYSGFAFSCFLVVLILYFAYLRKAMARTAKFPQKEAQINEKQEEKTEVPTPNDPLVPTISDDL